MKPTDIYFFSGTANTFAAVSAVKKTLEESAVEVNLHPMERVDPSSIQTGGRVIGLAFPVAFQSTYPMVWHFMENLPPVEDTDVFMLDTLAHMSMGIVGPLRKLMVKKGYNPVGAVEIIMPTNLGRTKPFGPDDEAMINRGMEKAAEFAKSLAVGGAHWPKGSFIEDVICAISRSPLTGFFIKKAGGMMKVNMNLCFRCSLCSKLCPTDNIWMTTGPAFKKNCQVCMRCHSICPKQAVIPISAKFAPYVSGHRDEFVKFLQDYNKS